MEAHSLGVDSVLRVNGFIKEIRTCLLWQIRQVHYYLEFTL